MRDSRFLVILIIISIFVIIGSVFFFIFGNKKVENEEITEEMLIQDEKVVGSEDNVSVDKQVKVYDEEKDSNSSDVTNSVSTPEVSNNNQNTQQVVAEKSAPQIPTLTSIPVSTNKDSENVEVNGEANAEIFVNDWSVGFLDANGKKTISLNTAGGDGNKSFAIFLRNQAGKSGILNAVVKKSTTSTTSVNTTNSNTSTTSSTKKTWAYIYTNREKFDIDDYDDYDELKLRDVCKSASGSYSYCYKTSSLSDKNNESLGNKKCPSSCRAGQTCLLWNSEEKSSGSLYSWVAMYRCQ